MSFFGFELSPEKLAEIREAQDRVNMNVEAFRHGVINLIDSLDADQLGVLQRMLHQGMHDAASDGPENLLAMWDGMIRGRLAYQFGVCQSCMVNHSDDIFGAPEGLTDEVNPAKGNVSGANPHENHVHVQMFTRQGDTRPFSLHEIEMAEKYHVTDVRVEETNEFRGVTCTGIKGMKEGCGHVWPDLEDRMLRDPEDCGGCHLRSAHG